MSIQLIQQYYAKVEQLIRYGVPCDTRQYCLGTYTALECVLERYKEKTPKDPTIREKFNTYRFKDYREQVIELLGRVYLARRTFMV